MEIWKDVIGFEGVYQISSLGRLKSFRKIKSGYIMSLKNKNGDYFSVVLSNGEISVSTRIHRLVASHFILNPENKPQVNHKNLNKQDNNIKNLEWVTCKENMVHAAKNSPHFLKSMINRNRFSNPKSVIQKAIGGKKIAEFVNCKEAMKKTGVCSRNILQVASKTEYKPGLTRKQAGGFVWEFK